MGIGGDGRTNYLSMQIFYVRVEPCERVSTLFFAAKFVLSGAVSIGPMVSQSGIGKELAKAIFENLVRKKQAGLGNRLPCLGSISIPKVEKL
jgi:hypothetical protein